MNPSGETLMKDVIFADRAHAGQLLAGVLGKYADRNDVPDHGSIG